MSRLQELREECAKKFEFKDWNDLRSFHILEDVPRLEEIENDVIAQYTEECVKASLEKASENAEADHHKYEIAMQPHVVKSSVTNPENIILL